MDPLTGIAYSRAKETKITRTRSVQITIGVISSGLCLYLALRGLAWQEVGESFGRANYATLPLFMVLLFLFFWLKCIRWRLILQPVRKLQTRELTPALMIGFMGNNLLPAHLGELVRVFVLGHQLSLSKTAVFSSVLLERILDAVVILMLLVSSLILVEDLPAWIQTGSLWMGTGVIVTILLLTAYCLRTEWFIQKIRRWGSLLPHSFGHRLVELILSGTQGLNSLKNSRLALGIAVTSLSQWLLMGAMVYLSMSSFGIRVNPLASLVTVGVVAIGVSVPSTPGFFGVVQLCFWISLQGFGVEKADAFASSIYFHLSQYVPVTLIGLYFLSRSGFRLGQVEQTAQTGLVQGSVPAALD